jgi:hypothetical protein
MGKKSGSGMNNPAHISESLETILGLKYKNFLMGFRDGKNSDPGETSLLRDTVFFILLPFLTCHLPFTTLVISKSRI